MLGPDMTIKSQGRYRPTDSENYHLNGTYECQWFAGKKLEFVDFK